MNTAGIKTGDIVRCDVRGIQFYAHIELHDIRAERMGGFRVDPLKGSTKSLPTRVVTARQIKEHYSKRKG